MTDVLVTVDTELSCALHQQGVSAADNVARSIEGRVSGGRFGVGWQMDRMEAHGLRGVFFVDPLPALVHGTGILRDIVGPILARGHEVQLHVHTEWLAWAPSSPIGGRRGRTIGAFSLDDQIALLAHARALLEAAGVPRPVAFRAGNYGADDDTLIALARLGLTWDSSLNAAYLGDTCRIGLPADTAVPTRRHGVIEVPIGAILDRADHARPAQVCALSAAEMRAALDHVGAGTAPFVIVTHSFEMLSRDRLRPNRAVMARFEAMCRTIAADPRLRTVGFRDLDPALADAPATGAGRLPPNRLRTWGRIAEQGWAALRYERRA